MAALSKEEAAKILGVQKINSLEGLREAYRSRLQETCQEGPVGNFNQQQRLQEVKAAYTRLVSDMEQRHQGNRGNDGGNSNTSSSKETSSKSSGNKKKKQLRKQDTSNAKFATSSSSSAASSASSASSLSLPPLPFPPEFAAKCLNAATAAAVAGGNVNMNVSASGGASVTITKGRMFGPSPPPTEPDSNSKDSSSKHSNPANNTANIDLAALAQSGFSFADLGMDISAQSGTNSNPDSSTQPPCSEAEMKALMSMFVEFVGMVSDQDNIGRSGSSGESSGNKSSTPGPSISRENFIRLNAAALAAASASNIQGQNANASFQNLSSSKMGSQNASTPFPVFSMLLGAGAGTGDFPLDPGKISKKNVSNNSKSNRDGQSRGGHSSAPQARPIHSTEPNSDSYTCDETGSEWIDYYGDEVDDNNEGNVNSCNIANELERNDNDDDDDDGDGSSIDDIIIDGHNHINNDRFVDWSRKIHSVINVADSFSRESKKPMSPLRHKRSKPHSQDSSDQINQEEVMHNSNSQSFKANRSRGNKDANTGSFTMTNGKYKDIMKTYSGPINNVLAQKASKMGIDWDSLREEKDFGDSTIGALDVDRYYYRSDQGKLDKNQKLDEEHQNGQNEILCKAEEEEKARKAAKKREKKNRKKEKAKREAALKAAQSAQKRREAKITSWRSRVVTACSNGEINKLEALLGDSPFKNLEKSGVIPNTSEKYDLPVKKEIVEEDSSDLAGETGSLNEFTNDDVPQHMEWILHACFPRYKQKSTRAEREAKHKLSLYVMKMSFEVIFQPVRNGRNLLHAAAQMGDVEFVKNVIEHIENKSDSKGGKESLRSNLNVLCEDAGWSALHYASAFGWTDVIEALLASGSDVMTTTNPSLTRWSSNGNGVSAREIIELLQSGDATSHLHCHGKALQEASDNYFNTIETSKDTTIKSRGFNDMISRLLQIEQHGYSLPSKSKHSQMKTMQDSSTNEKLRSRQQKDAKSSSNQSTNAKQNSGEETKKKKRNRKKKGQQQQSDSGSKNTSSKPIETSDKSEKVIDPLVTALLSMGFTSAQITAAASACGGTNNATADDLVAWIFENESGNNDDSQANSKNNASNQEQEAGHITSSVDTAGTGLKNNADNSPLHDHVTMLKAQHQQRMADLAAAQVIKDEEAAAEREREAKAAAQRLAAKREEQRRINREWNNREQVRQKEEAQAKVMEEMEKRRIAEIGKAKEAQKRAQLLNTHTVIPSQNVPVQVRVPHPQQVPHHSVVLPSVVAGHPPHFQHHHPVQLPYENTVASTSVDTKHYDMLPPDIRPINNGQTGHSDGMHFRRNRPHNQNQSRNPYPNQMMGRPSPHMYMNDPNSSEYNNTGPMQHGNVLPVYIDNGYQVDGYGNVPLQRDKSSTAQDSAPHLEVNAFDFPELGKDKGSKEVKEKMSQSQYPSNDNKILSGGIANRKNTRGKGKNAKNSYSPANMKRPVSPSPPPGFPLSSTPPYPESVTTNASESSEINTSEEPNQLGEIRATAKVFVPTFFKPPPAISTTSTDSTLSVSKAPVVMKSHQDQTNALPSQSAPPPFMPQPFLQSSLPIHGNTSDNDRPEAFDATAALLAPVNSLLNSSGHSTIPGDDSANVPSSSLLSSVSSSRLAPNISALSSNPNSAPSSSPHSPIQSSASSITGAISKGEDLGLTGNGLLLENHQSVPGGGSSILESIPSNQSMSLSSGLENVPVTGNSNIWGGASNSSTGLGGFSAFSIGATSTLRSSQSDASSNVISSGFNENGANETTDTEDSGWGALGGGASGGMNSIW